MDLENEITLEDYIDLYYEDSRDYKDQEYLFCKHDDYEDYKEFIDWLKQEEIPYEECNKFAFYAVFVKNYLYVERDRKNYWS